MTITHAFSLYRSGYSDENAFPWPDNQLWASEVSVLTDNAENAVILRPDYGSAAALYRVSVTYAAVRAESRSRVFPCRGEGCAVCSKTGSIWITCARCGGSGEL